MHCFRIRKAFRCAPKKYFIAKKYVDEVFTRGSIHSKIFQKISLYYNKQGLKWKPITSASQILKQNKNRNFGNLHKKLIYVM